MPDDAAARHPMGMTSRGRCPAAAGGRTFSVESMSTPSPLQRAPGTPALPVKTFRFVLYALRGFGLAYGMMLLFETLAAASGIMTPYALSRIIKAVTGAREQSMSMVDTLTAPLLLFVGLALAEVVFGASSARSRFAPGRTCARAWCARSTIICSTTRIAT